eukprot:532977-Pelagomonas_calceolata.AAC.3
MGACKAKTSTWGLQQATGSLIPVFCQHKSWMKLHCYAVILFFPLRVTTLVSLNVASSQGRRWNAVGKRSPHKVVAKRAEEIPEGT